MIFIEIFFRFLCVEVAKIGAGNEIRTRDPDLGKVVLYQLSYSRALKCQSLLSMSCKARKYACWDRYPKEALILMPKCPKSS